MRPGDDIIGQLVQSVSPWSGARVDPVPAVSLGGFKRTAYDTVSCAGYQSGRDTDPVITAWKRAAE